MAQISVTRFMEQVVREFGHLFTYSPKGNGKHCAVRYTGYSVITVVWHPEEGLWSVAICPDLGEVTFGIDHSLRYAIDNQLPTGALSVSIDPNDIN